MGTACLTFGHDPEFRSEGTTMHWLCRRSGCSDGGSKQYATAADAQKYAAAFNRRDNEDLGKRAPLLGLLPLRLWHWVRNRG
jgi:hypothetical protein